MNEGLGVFLIQRGLHAHARHYLDKAILIDPLEPLFYVNRGLNFHWQGDFVRAEADYLSALQLEPQLTAAIEQYAHLLIEKIRFEEAELYLKKLDPGRSSTQFLNNKYFAFSGNRLFPGKNIDSTSNLQLIGLMGLNEAAVDFYLAALPAEKLNKISYYWLYETSPCYDKLREDKHFQNYLAEHKKIYEQNLITFGKQ
jgi:tetratricopeptide (TPR) repeat protein